mgnify:CR=1 FL=1
MSKPSWRSVGVVLMPLVDIRYVRKARANENVPPPGPPRRLAPLEFLALVDGSQEEEPPPAT